MSFRKKHWVLGASILAASALTAGCGGSDSTMEEEMTVPTATPTPTPTPEPMATPTGAIEGIPQTTGFTGMLTAALADLMGDDGEHVNMKDHPIDAGMDWVVGGVRFSCVGADDCTVKLMVTRDEAGMITGISADYEGGMVTAEFIDPFEQMNDADTAAIAALINRRIDELMGMATPDDAGTPLKDETAPAPPRGPYGITGDNSLNLRKGAMGIGSADLSKVTLTGNLDPNVDPISMDPPVSTGSAIGAEMDSVDDAGAIGLEGWSHAALHADWGDSKHPDRDGGFETAAVIYSNVEASTPVPFAQVRSMLAFNDGINRAWFKIVTEDPGHADFGAVAILAITTATNNPVTGPWKTARDAMVFNVAAPTVEETTLVKERNDAIKGTYFGAPGTFTCTSDGSTPALTCSIVRTEGGATPFKTGTGGAWRFKPDPGAMVELPDQDWLAFGFWLTTPDDSRGTHRIGVFYDGMEEYAHSTAQEPGGKLEALRGTATYEGAAAGYYVDGLDDGLFTARANLTAKFDVVDSTGGTLEGRIDNFRTSEGAYLGADTPANPNDPVTGGEGDWYVSLMSNSIGGGGDVVVMPTLEADVASTGLTAGLTAGSADGVPWNGTWSAQLYGAGGRPDTDAPFLGIAPTGVAGDFRAVGSLGNSQYRGVVGAFGAELAPGSHKLP